MTEERGNERVFAPMHDVPIPYLQRTRDYYQALGYGAPYVWAHYADVPFRLPSKPLGESRVALIMTAAPYQPAARETRDRSATTQPRSSTRSTRDTTIDHDLRIATQS
jgi:hypothetical protein